MGGRSLKEATYVPDMYAFLDGTAENLERVPTPWIVDRNPLHRKIGESDRLSTKHAVQWFLRIMRLRRVLLARDYEVLRVNLNAEAACGPISVRLLILSY